jgi:hypothetical protein
VKDPSLEFLFLAGDEHSADCAMCLDAVEAPPTKHARSHHSGPLVEERDVALFAREASLVPFAAEVDEIVLQHRPAAAPALHRQCCEPAGAADSAVLLGGEDLGRQLPVAGRAARALFVEVPKAAGE